ncbi:MAG: tetraacyldisaccharide 4'-kinase [Proteobacteria bacterium]|nr:tetraacyldisaccharide 4'-kinase [Pseudomonadota bacterium]
MNIRSSFERLITMQKPGALLSLALVPLACASYIFQGVVWLRRLLYEKEIFKSYRLPCPVLSIGNITVGGTGKTPAVYHIARHLKDAGYRVVILCRGYRAQDPGQGLVVADGSSLLAGPEQAGDEPFMLAQKLRDVPVLAGRDRVSLGQRAVRDFAAQVIIIDDGFHYFRLKRDLDIVLINSRNPFGNGYLLPRGTLREPIASIGRAQLIMLSKVDQTTNAAGLEKTIQKYNPRTPIFNASLQAQAFRSTANDETLSLEALKGKRAAAVCSIGDPDSFFSLLESLGVTVTARLAFPDHHWYDEADYRIINDSGNSADFIITTEKDIAKLDETMLGKRKFFALQTRMQVAGEDQFFNTIRACVAELITTEQH